MIGANLTARLIRDGHDVTIIDNFWRGSIANLRECCGNGFDKVEIIPSDLSALSDWQLAFKDKDVVFHLADIVAGVSYVFDNQAYVFRKNLQINANVAAAISLFRPKRYIYVGTACSFPQTLQTGVDAAPMKEDQQIPADPESAYGWSKLMGELDAKYLAEDLGLDSVVLVFHNVYGTPCEYNSNRSQVLPALCHKAITSTSGSLEVWGSGQQGRAFVHVDDVVEALVLTLTKGENVGPIQIGPDICTSIADAAQVIIDTVNPSLAIEFNTDRPEGDRGRCADYTKARELLGWEPKVVFADGVGKMCDWIEMQENRTIAES